MSKHLVIVESPAKAKTIEKYLGSDFRVRSSVGHIRSIPKKTKDGTPPVDIEHDFATTYEVDSEKKKIIAELRKQVKAVGKDNVWLATDEDREGEAIAWHLCEVLGLDPATTKRIVFHEITKSAIEHAIKHPRTVDMQLVEAQQARQILDRIVGFELSPVVWQKVPGGKSAGRVQSPAVRLLVEREREIRDYETSSEFKVSALFFAHGQEFKSELATKFATEAQARAFLESLDGAVFTVSDITTSPGTRNPAAPFTTSTLQQEANSRLGYGSKATMASAQKLYQDGKITYMRTDSTALSGQAIAAAADYIKRLYGPEYSQIRKHTTKSAGAQEAHEAIRPTDISLETASDNEYDQKLYDLIRRRTLASQMAPATLEKTEVTITTQHVEAAVFKTKGSVVVFDGFLRVYGGGKDEHLPNLTSGDQLGISEISARQVFSRPPARYTEGSLVKKLEDLGIGRPSTYATIIDTVQTRGYVEKGTSDGTEREVIVLQLTADAAAESATDSSQSSVIRTIETEATGSTKGKLVPTPAGELIADFLGNHFSQIVDYGFTAHVEEEFDDIAAGQLARNAMLQTFYTPFHALIEQSSTIDRSTVGTNREVGIDPKSGKPIFARFGRFGPMLQLGATDTGGDKPQFAPMPKGARIETVTLEQALEAFKLPRIVGTTEDGQDIKANIGRFGPYIQVGTLYVSLKEDDPKTIDETRARQLYAAKLAAEAAKHIADFGDGVKVLNGRFGPYVTDGTKNAKVPKDTDPASLTHADAKELLAKSPSRRRRSPPKKKNSVSRSTNLR
ncbi:DNA topoisomerase I [Candidatus Saccharibacteria bacterium]|nr:MAG: DNA topoisomerase I [Candidatus Saccharibacteria bacterium]